MPKPEKANFQDAGELVIAFNRQFRPIISEKTIYIGDAGDPISCDYRIAAKKIIEQDFSTELNVFDRQDITNGEPPSTDICSKVISGCGLYLSILGDFYGEIYASEDISHTEYELRLAKETGKKVLVLLLLAPPNLPSMARDFFLKQAQLIPRQNQLHDYVNSNSSTFWLRSVSGLDEFEENLRECVQIFKEELEQEQDNPDEQVNLTSASSASQFLGEYKHLNFDRRPVLFYTLRNLDNALIDLFLEQPQARRRLGRSQLLRATKEEHLKLLEVLDSNGRPTLGGFLCFSPQILLIDKFAACSLHMVVYSETTRALSKASPDLAQDNLLNLFEIGMNFLNSEAAGLRRTGQIGTNKRDDLEVPEIALREALVNALVHRDYEHSSVKDQPTRIEIYPDRIEITSFGSLPDGVSETQLNQEPENVTPIRRNHVIATIFQVMQRAELNASGVARMYSLAQEFQLPAPEIIQSKESTTVKVIFRRPPKDVLFKSVNTRDVFLTDDILGQIPNELLPEVTKLNSFGRQLVAWFETLGYGLEACQLLEDSKFELLVTIPVRRKNYIRVVVRGVTGEVGLSDLNSLQASVQHYDADEGWLVSSLRVSSGVRKAIQEDNNLTSYTFDELLDEDADFSQYLEWLEAEIRAKGIDHNYIPLACLKDEIDPATNQKIGMSRYGENEGWVKGYVDRWLEDSSKEHLSVLGEFGTGKTWFALHYAWLALQEYTTAKQKGLARPRLPLVIPLRDYAKAVSVESLFSEFFFRKHEIPIPGYNAFEQLNRMGKLLLIFDGFDEMAARVSRLEMINNFWELARLVVPRAKVILTCRTEHFPEAREGRSLLNAELQASTRHLTGQTPQFEVVELEQFDDSQIRQLLSFKTQPKIVKQIFNNTNLIDLAFRPVMADLILEALPDIEAGKPVDISRVYLYAVTKKLERDIRSRRTFTSLADKLYFLCELSWEMVSTNQMSLNYRAFPTRLRQMFGMRVQEESELDHWRYDMMGQTMLIRNSEGDYSPAHRSLLEFFVAYKFAAELGLLAEDFIKIAQKQSHLNSQNPQNYTWSSYFQRQLDESGLLQSIVPLNKFTCENFSHLKSSFGTVLLSEKLITFLGSMIDRTKATQQLKAILAEVGNHSVAEVGYISANIESLIEYLDNQMNNETN